MDNKILQALGYYKIKKQIKHRLFCNRLIREDAAKKRNIQAEIMEMDGCQLFRSHDASDIIVSLTSYGIRVNDTLPYALYSLLQQSYMPNRIVVWLDNKNWDEEKLPLVLKKFEALGIEFYFVEDLRSYKKLIPALKMFPDNVIITVDDDWYYNKHLVEWFLKAYNESDKKTVFGSLAFSAAIDDKGYLPYSKWEEPKTNDDHNNLSLIGCGGILYPPHIFDEEILNDKLFMELAPKADDLWFWAMEKRASVGIKLIPNGRFGLHTAINRVEIYEPQKALGSLYYFNGVLGGNDAPFERLISKYNLIPYECDCENKA